MQIARAFNEQRTIWPPLRASNPNKSNLPLLARPEAETVPLKPELGSENFHKQSLPNFFAHPLGDTRLDDRLDGVLCTFATSTLVALLTWPQAPTRTHKSRTDTFLRDDILSTRRHAKIMTIFYRPT